MTAPRITEIRISGMRTLAEVRLKLNGLTILIGDNGTGKSSLIEAIELLRVSAQSNFTERFVSTHGGLRALLRAGAQRLALGLKVEEDGEAASPLNYSFSIAYEGESVVVERETLDVGPLPGKETALHVIQRDRSRAKIFDQTQGALVDAPTVPADTLLLSAFGRLPPPVVQRAIGRMIQVLSEIEVHLPFDVMPYWAGRETRRSSPLREPQLLEPTQKLFRFGRNLASAYHTLRNDTSESHWQETMEYVRLGLGDNIESVNVRIDPGGGAAALALKFKNSLDQVPAFVLSDGMLSYLAFVALYRLPTGRSILAMDEPETHLHPRLLMRVLGMFESEAKQHPVVLATHSDRLLDGLSPEAAESVALCELDESRATRLLRPQPDLLARWLKRYRGIGDLRGEGYESAVFTRDQ